MPDKAKDNSKTGEVRQIDLEPLLQHEPNDTSDLPIETLEVNSTTGVMRIVAEKAHDDTAERDEDTPN